MGNLSGERSSSDNSSTLPMRGSGRAEVIRGGGHNVRSAVCRRFGTDLLELRELALLRMGISDLVGGASASWDPKSRTVVDHPILLPELPSS